MTTSSNSNCAWTEATIARVNARLGVQHDGPAAMSDPGLIDAAIDAYDSASGADERALIVELLLNTFEFTLIGRDGNPDWRRTLDRIERGFSEHAATIQNWADPEDGNPWLISDDMQSLLDRSRSRG
jgi:hypothetical protein